MLSRWCFRLPAIAALGATLGCGVPSDASLIERFQRQRGDYERLVELLQRDEWLCQLKADGTFTPCRHEMGLAESHEGLPREFPPERAEEYRRLVRRLDLASVAVDRGPCMSVEFVQTVWGFAFSSGSGEKGLYYHCPGSQRSPELPSLESGPAEEPRFRGYRPIDDAWSVFIQR